MSTYYMVKSTRPNADIKAEFEINQRSRLVKSVNTYLITRKM